MTFANAQDFAIAAAASFEARMLEEKKNAATMSASQLDTMAKKCKQLQSYFASANSEQAMTVMFQSSLNVDFINTKGIGGKYVVKKVYELANYLCGGTGKLDTYDLRYFRTLILAGEAGVPLNKQELKACINHDAPVSDAVAPCLFRIPGMHKGDETAEPQFGSSLANFRLYGIAKMTTCADTGKDVYMIDFEAFATKLLMSRLGIKRAETVAE